MSKTGECLDNINDLLGLTCHQAASSDGRFYEIKGWKPDDHGRNVLKFFLDKEDCQTLAAAFKTLSEEMQER
jgi:hypothetical protein